MPGAGGGGGGISAHLLVLHWHNSEARAHGFQTVPREKPTMVTRSIALASFALHPLYRTFPASSSVCSVSSSSLEPPCGHRALQAESTERPTLASWFHPDCLRIPEPCRSLCCPHSYFCPGVTSWPLEHTWRFSLDFPEPGRAPASVQTWAR